MKANKMNRDRRPSDDECFDYHRNYVAKVPDGDIVQTLSVQLEDIANFIANILPDQADVVHEPYGWSIRQVIEHCLDAERVFGYRILRFATGDKTDLPGWDENTYASTDYGPDASIFQLGQEFAFVRQSNLMLLSRLSESAWNEVGLADGRKVSVRTLAWLMAGHWLHHHEILKKRLETAG